MMTISPKVQKEFTKLFVELLGKRDGEAMAAVFLHRENWPTPATMKRRLKKARLTQAKPITSTIQ